MRSRRKLPIVLLPLFAVVALPVMTAPAAAGDARGVGKWLVDLGRDYPLSPQAAPTDVDAELTLLFMEAAARVDPQLGEPHLWQYELLMALGRESAARDSLAAYLRREPADEVAHLRWVQLAVAAFQTAEERAEFCRRHLERESLAAVVRSDLHRRLAEFHWNRAETAQAETELATALRHDPLNLQARILRVQLQDAEHLVVQQIRILLEVLAGSPARSDVAREVGEGLTLLGLLEEADSWFLHALRLHEPTAGGPSVPPPVDLLVARAEALVDAGRLEEADELARQALEREEGLVAAHLVRARATRDAQRADEHIARAGEILRGRMGQRGAMVDRGFVAEVAWYMARYERRADEAERLARLVMAEGPELPVARRALGAALRAQGRRAEAEVVLEPAAAADVWAGIELVRILVATERSEEAEQRLLTLAVQPLTGEQRGEIRELAADLQVQLPPDPAAERVRAEARTFPHEVLRYPLEPEQCLSLRWRVTGSPAAAVGPQGELRPGEPWWCNLRLTNEGAFTITLGEGLMVDPELLCAVRTRGDRERSSGPTLRISLHRRLYLMPGESIDIAQTLDVGPVRAGMIGTPQIEHEVEVTGVLSPIRLVDAEGQEVWAPNLGGLLAEPLTFRRRVLGAGGDESRALISQSRSGSLAERGDALELLAMLLAEHQHLGAGRLRYEARRLDAASVQGAVLARAGDGDWQVRARLAECLRWIALDTAAHQTATRLASDSHWLVRGLTLRALADHHAGRFTEVLERGAAADPDEWVRRLSTVLLSRMRRAADVGRTEAVERPGRPAVQQPQPQAADPAPPAAQPEKPGPVLLLPDTAPDTPSPR